MGPFLTPDRHRAIQNEPRSPPSPSAALPVLRMPVRF